MGLALLSTARTPKGKVTNMAAKAVATAKAIVAVVTAAVVRALVITNKENKQKMTELPRSFFVCF
jgi:hypothetical protein